MPHPLPTVTIESDNGHVRINASDYDPSEHKIVDESAPVKPAANTRTVAQLKEALTAKGIEDLSGKKADLIERLEAAPDAPATLPEGSTVSEREGRHFVTDKDGKDVVSELVNADGYETSAEAWAIVMPS